MKERHQRGTLKVMVREHRYDGRKKGHRWNWECKCGRYGGRPGFETEKECMKDAAEHAGNSQIVTGPKIIIEKYTISIPRENPGEQWVWRAWNERDESDPSFHGCGRSEAEAIENLEFLNQARMTERSLLREGYTGGDWLDFQSWGKKPNHEQKLTPATGIRCN